MAELNKTVLGKVRGSIGELTFRQRNGKNVIAMKPSSFMPGTDAASIARRERFKLTIKLAKVLNGISFIKEYWSSMSPGEMTGFNFLFKTNYQFLASNDIVSNPMIMPVMGFAVSNPIGTFNENSFEISLNAIGNSAGIDSLTETNMSLVNILFLKDPVNSALESNYLSSIISENIPLQLTDPVTFSVNIPDNQLYFYNNYTTKKVFSVLQTFDAENQIVHFSNTFSV
jgi:hypothetical protein